MGDGVLVVVHEQLARMSDGDIERALGARWAGHDVEVLRLELEGDPDARAVEWDRARRLQRQWVDEVFAPARERAPGRAVCYVGAAHVALALELGSWIGHRERVWCGAHDHESGEWGWREESGVEGQDPRVEGLPGETLELEGPVVVRVHASREVDVEATRAVVSGAIAQVDVRLDPIRRVPCASHDELDALADAFSEVLAGLERTRPRASAYHLFIAGPPSVCCALGARVRLNEVPPIHVYQRVRASDPPFRRVSVLGAREEAAERAAGATKALIGRARAWWAEELGELRAWAAHVREAAAPHAGWLETLGVEPPAHGRALSLVRLDEVAALDAELEQAWRADIDGFRYDFVAGTWSLTEELMTGLVRRVRDEERVRQAARLFFLHEGVHLQGQRLTGFTSPGVGRRHPELVEEADYLADVWGMMHELGRRAWRAGRADVGADLGPMIEDAIETFWAFDDGPGLVERMQRRRVRRYLTWGWLRLHAARGVTTLDDAWRVLSERPVVSLSGLEAYVDLEGRHMLRLDRVDDVSLEFAALVGGRVAWSGTRSAHTVRALVDALRRRDTEAMLAALRVCFEEHHAI